MMVIQHAEVPDETRGAGVVGGGTNDIQRGLIAAAWAYRGEAWRVDAPSLNTPERSQRCLPRSPVSG
jgi:hypothetical protein